MDSQSQSHAELCQRLASHHGFDLAFANRWDGKENPLGLYCETFWLPVIGPTTYVMGRRFAYWLTDNTHSFELADLSILLGLGEGTGKTSPVVRSLARLMRYGLATMAPSTNQRTTHAHEICLYERWPHLSHGHRPRQHNTTSEGADRA